MVDEAPTEKRCTKCGEVKPLEAFGVLKKGKYGRRGVCIECRRAHDQANIESIRAYSRARRAANREKIREYDRLFYAAHAKARNERSRAYHKANVEKIKKQKQEYRARNADIIREKRLADAEKHRQRSKDWHAANVEQQREYRRRYYAPELQRARRAANLDMYRAIGNRYQARKKANGGNYTAEQIREMRLAQAGICAYCGYQYDPNDLQIEHIIPVCQGGSNDISNLCLACVPCNCSKKGRTPEQWTNRWYERKRKDDQGE